MKAVVLAVAAAYALGGCASWRARHEARHVGGPAMASSAERADQQIKYMQEMHQKMLAAETPQERHALMAEHMKAMQGGMSMMCEMGSGANGRSTWESQDMMNRCMAMKDMTMQMMMDRESEKPPVKPGEVAPAMPR